MPAKRPAYFTLRGRRWRVRWVRGLVDDDGKSVWGLCDYAARTISIERDQPPDAMPDTVIHEILHVSFPSAREKRIRRAASDLLRALTRLGLVQIPKEPTTL